jgi:lysophospholipase L1-like esterase
VIGDSIHAGYGALGKVGDRDCCASESHWDSYGAQLARMLDAELTTIAVSGMGVIRNYAGATDFTMREMYPRTLPNEPALWCEPHPLDAVVINLGTNDISAGQTMQTRVQAALDAFDDANALWNDGSAPLGTNDFACDYHPNHDASARLAEQIAEAPRTRLGWR